MRFIVYYNINFDLAKIKQKFEGFFLSAEAVAWVPIDGNTYVESIPYS